VDPLLLFDFAIQRGLLTHGVARPIDYLRGYAPYTIEGLADRIAWPTLIIEAENDVRGGNAKPLYDAIVAPKEYMLFSNAEGERAHDEAEAASLFARRVFDWLDETLDSVNQPVAAHGSALLGLTVAHAVSPPRGYDGVDGRRRREWSNSGEPPASNKSSSATLTSSSFTPRESGVGSGSAPNRELSDVVTTGPPAPEPGTRCSSATSSRFSRSLTGTSSVSHGPTGNASRCRKPRTVRPHRPRRPC